MVRALSQSLSWVPTLLIGWQAVSIGTTGLRGFFFLNLFFSWWNTWHLHDWRTNIPFADYEDFSSSKSSRKHQCLCFSDRPSYSRTQSSLLLYVPQGKLLVQQLISSKLLKPLSWISSFQHLCCLMGDLDLDLLLSLHEKRKTIKFSRSVGASP